MSDRKNGAGKRKTVTAKRTPQAPIRIMLFDANPDTAQFTKLALQQADAPHPDYFKKLQLAVYAHHKAPYDIILVDMPLTAEVPEAVKLTRQIRKFEQVNRTEQKIGTHIVAILPEGRKDGIKAAIWAGANAIWLKPLSGQIVADRLSKISDIICGDAPEAEQLTPDALLKKLSDY